MVSTQHTTFSAAQRTHSSPTLVAPSNSESAAEQFVNVLDQLLGKSTKVKRPDSFNDLSTKPAELIYREKEEAAPVSDKDSAENVENSEVTTEFSNDESTDTKEEVVVDASTVSLLVNKEQVDQAQIQKVATATETQVANSSQNKAEVIAQNQLFSNEKTAVAEAFKLVKQVQQSADRAEVSQPLEQLQTSLENFFKAQPEKTQSASNTVESSAESDLKIEAFVETDQGLREFGATSTTPAVLKKTSESGLNLAAPTIASNLAEKYSAELAKLSTRGSLGAKLVSEFSREREPVAALSLLGEKSKVQTSKETGKSNQLTSRQEQIINQILKLVDQAAKLKDGSSISIRIKPEELGEVLVKVTQRGDQLFARIIPESKEVEHTVRTGINEVIAQLVSAGFKPDNIHVAVGKELSETERFSALHNGANQTLDSETQGQNLLNKGDRHSSSLSNPNSSGSKSDSKNAFSTARDVVDNGWVA